MNLLIAVPVAAKVYFAELKPNKHYYNYDITGDGKKDDILYMHSSSDDYLTNGLYYMSIYVNGNKQTDKGSSRGGSLYYCKFDNENEFLLEDDHFAGGASDMIVYKWKKGKLIQINTKFENDIYNLNEQDFRFKNWGRTSNKKYVYILREQKWNKLKSFPYTDASKFSVRHFYTGKNGKLKLVSRAGDVQGKQVFMSYQSFKTSKSVNKLGKKNGVKIKKGDKVTLKKIYFTKNGGVCYCVHTKHGNGWFADSSKLILF